MLLSAVIDEGSFVNRWLQKWIMRFGLESRPRLRRFLIGVIGFRVVLIGLVMIVLPGPAILIVPLGFAILASGFAWARRVWRRAQFWFRVSAANRSRGNRWKHDEMATDCLAPAAEHGLFSLCTQRSFTPLM